MPSLETPGSPVTSRHCPACGAGSNSVRLVTGGQTVTQGTCSNGHVWLMKWVEA